MSTRMLLLAMALGAGAVAGGGACAAQTPCEPIDLPAPGGAHILPGTRIGITYATRAGTPLAFDLFRHDGTTARPTAIVLRGGEGDATVGDRLSYVGQLVETVAAAGYNVVLPDYRSSSVGDADADLLALTETLRCHAGDLGIDDQRLVVVGENSGADAALRLTADLWTKRLGRTSRWPSPPVATVALAATYANVPGGIDGPTLLVHGGGDRDVPVDRPKAICQSAREGTPCDVLEVAGASYRVENWWPSQWHYKAQMIAWLATHVGEVPKAAWPDDPRLRKQLVYDDAHGLTLDAYIPEGPGPFAAAILVHGGGWEAGDRVTYITPMFQPLAARQIAWFSIDYRLTPEVTNDAQIDDVARALAFVKAHAAEYRVDPRRLVLVGESASGQLVAHLATRRAEVAGVVSFYGVYDFLAMKPDVASPRSLPQRLFRITALDDASRATLREYSPIHHVGPDMPPMLLVTGSADGLWAQAQAFDKALSEAGAAHDNVVVPDAPHGMEQWNRKAEWRSWSTTVVDWIEKVTARPE